MRGGQDPDQIQSSGLLAFLMLSVIPLPHKGILLLQQKEEAIWCSLADAQGYHKYVHEMAASKCRTDNGPARGDEELHRSIAE